LVVSYQGFGEKQNRTAFFKKVVRLLFSLSARFDYFSLSQNPNLNEESVLSFLIIPENTSTTYFCTARRTTRCTQTLRRFRSAGSNRAERVGGRRSPHKCGRRRPPEALSSSSYIERGKNCRGDEKTSQRNPTLKPAGSKGHR